MPLSNPKYGHDKKNYSLVTIDAVANHEYTDYDLSSITGPLASSQ